MHFVRKHILHNSETKKETNVIFVPAIWLMKKIIFDNIYALQTRKVNSYAR